MPDRTSGRDRKRARQPAPGDPPLKRQTPSPARPPPPSATPPKPRALLPPLLDDAFDDWLLAPRDLRSPALARASAEELRQWWLCADSAVYLTSIAGAGPEAFHTAASLMARLVTRRVPAVLADVPAAFLACALVAIRFHGAPYEPSAHSAVGYFDGRVSGERVLGLELEVLKAVDFRVQVPTAYAVLVNGFVVPQVPGDGRRGWWSQFARGPGPADGGEFTPPNDDTWLRRAALACDIDPDDFHVLLGDARASPLDSELAYLVDLTVLDPLLAAAEPAVVARACAALAALLREAPSGRWPELGCTLAAVAAKTPDELAVSEAMRRLYVVHLATWGDGEVGAVACRHAAGMPLLVPPAGCLCPFCGVAPDAARRIAGRVPRVGTVREACRGLERVGGLFSASFSVS